MKSLISILFLSIILTNCGFKPIYSSKNSNFQIIEIKTIIKTKIHLQLKKWLWRFQIKMD